MPGCVVVDVWTVEVAPRRSTDDPSGLAGLGSSVLDPAERARAATMPAHAAGRFVIGRVLLRQVLADRLGCAPGEVDLRVRCPTCGGPHGAVTVGAAGAPARSRAQRDRPPDLHVSVTRSGPLVAVAVCDGHAVGIDVESTAAVGAAPLAAVALSPRELGAARRRWGRGGGGRGTRSLARTWVRKEAALKALGTGLLVDPSSVDVQPPRGGARGVDAVVGEVAVADLRLGRGTLGAVAVVAPDLVRAAAPGEAGGAPRRLVVRRYDGVSTFSGRSS